MLKKLIVIIVALLVISSLGMSVSGLLGIASDQVAKIENNGKVETEKDTEGEPGDNTGGDNTGGDSTGGDNTGGDSTGGDNTGGDNTGGDSEGEVDNDLPAYTLTLKASEEGHENIDFIYANGQLTDVRDGSGYEGTVKGNCFLGDISNFEYLDQIMSYFDDLEGVIVIFEPYPEQEFEAHGIFVNGIELEQVGSMIGSEVFELDLGNGNFMDYTFYFYKVPMYTLTIQADEAGYDEIKTVYANGEMVDVSDGSGYEGLVLSNCFVGYVYTESEIKEILSHFNSMRSGVVIFEPKPEFDVGMFGYVTVDGVTIELEDLVESEPFMLGGAEITCWYYQVPTNTTVD